MGAKQVHRGRAHRGNIAPMKLAVGADIKAACNKCKLNTWHVIVAMVGTRIAKVQCKSCSAQHRFKSPDGAPGSAKATPARRSAKKKADAPLPAGPVVEPNLSVPIRAYSPREMFNVGERIDHIKFGIGVVENVPDAGKITVCFADARRVLAMAKKSGGLARPENRTFET